MKIAVMGAGAVGCYYGARLALGGHDVVLIGRSPHVAAMKERGLLLEIGGAVQSADVDATTEPSGIADAEIVLFCVKSGDTGAAGQAIMPHLGPDAAIVSLQNGVDNAERLQAVLGRQVIPSAVYVAVDMPAAGHVRHHGRGELVIGSGPASESIAGMFRQVGVPAEVSETVAGALWAKLILNCCYNPLSAIGQSPYGRLMEMDGICGLMEEVVSECLAVAAALGVPIPGDILGAVLGLAATMPDQMSSMAQDIARNRKTEIDDLNGYVVRTGARLGVATPVNRSLWMALKLLESRSAAR